VGVFTYSHEEGTPSGDQFDDDVSAKVKESRRAKLYAAQQENLSQRLKSWIGKELTVLVEGTHEETSLLLKGRHEGQAPSVDNVVLINRGSAKAGDFVRVCIEEVVGTDLVGGIVDKPTALS
jgi:ribosomal protein S12 methylthiotransferase